jgi:hypothetical protein
MPQSNFQIFSDICQDVYRTVLGHHQIKGVKVDVPRGWKSEILTTFRARISNSDPVQSASLLPSLGLHPTRQCL